MMNGVGGDLFAIVHDAARDRLHGLNASGWAPAGLSTEAAGVARRERDAADRHPRGHRAGRGGRLGGAARAGSGGCRWHECWRRRRGRARRLSRLGDRGGGVAWQRGARCARHANAARTFLPSGCAPRAGEVFRNPDLRVHLRADRRRRAATPSIAGDIATPPARVCRGSRRRPQRGRSAASSRPNGCSRCRRPTVDGRSTSCRRTVRAWRR